MFNSDVQDILKSYVYALVDPENVPFYIGKGVGNRVFSHDGGDAAAADGDVKSTRIQDIEAAGGIVKRIIIRWGLSDEVAKEIESALIDFGMNHGLVLTNRVRGRDSSIIGYIDAKELSMRLSATELVELATADVGHIIIVNINRTIKTVDGEPSERCYNAAREAWSIDSKKVHDLRYVLAENEGVIVGAFKIKIGGWYQRDSDNKWCFTGEVADREHIDRYVGKRIYKRPGDRAQFRYRLTRRDNE